MFVCVGILLRCRRDCFDYRSPLYALVPLLVCWSDYIDKCNSFLLYSSSYLFWPPGPFPWFAPWTLFIICWANADWSLLFFIFLKCSLYLYVYIYLPAQLFSGPRPVGLATVFCCLGFETYFFVASYDPASTRDSDSRLRVEVMLWSTGILPVCLGVKRPSGA
jgi:hypothetical protein